MAKTCTFWFMDQAHEPKWENLGKCGLEGTKGISSRVSSKGLQDWHLAWGDTIRLRELWF